MNTPAPIPAGRQYAAVRAVYAAIAPGQVTNAGTLAPRLHLRVAFVKRCLAWLAANGYLELLATSDNDPYRK